MFFLVVFSGFLVIVGGFVMEKIVAFVNVGLFFSTQSREIHPN